MGVAYKKLPTIQMLRFVAAALVILCHSGFYTAMRLDPDHAIYGQGARGVAVFFVISGLVMTMAISRSKHSLTSGLHFFWRRVVRIAPLYWSATFLKLAIVYSASHLAINNHVDFHILWRSLFFIPTMNESGSLEPFLGVGWTLNFEMGFYALMALSIASKISPYLVIAPVIGLLSILSILPYMSNDTWPIWLQFYANIVCINFLCGMVIGDLLKRGLILNLRMSRIFAPAAFIMIFAPFNEHIYESKLVVAGLSFLLVYSLVSIDIVMDRPPHPLWMFLGAASYAMYLFHPIFSPAVAQVFHALGLDLPVLATVGSVILGVAMGCILHQFLEKPLTRLFSPQPQAHRTSPDNRSRFGCD